MVFDKILGGLEYAQIESLMLVIIRTYTRFVDRLKNQFIGNIKMAMNLLTTY